MSARRAPVVAVTVLALFVAVTVPSWVLEVRAGSDASLDFGPYLPFFSYAAVGAVLIARRPRNPLGWCFTTIGALAVVLTAAAAWDDWSAHTGRPFGTSQLVAAAVGAGIWFPLLGTATVFALLLFPSGLPSRRWRPIAAVMAAGMLTLMALKTLAPHLSYGPHRTVPNPLAVLSSDDVESTPLFNAVGLLFFCGLVASGASQVARFRRSRGVERLQYKWFAVSAVLVAVTTTIAFLVPGQNNGLAGSLFSPVLAGVPVSCGLAVMRYRLYDIDRIVSRTFSWALVTAVLVGVYAAVVTAVGAALPAGSSSYAVAIATLAAVALLQPLRRRLQDVVDRRFNRERYDTSRMAAQFAARLRDEVELGEVQRDLLQTVAMTVAPAAASVWVRAGEVA